jgi:uncharacterized protein YbjT (DUF2867 family)
MKVIVFGATGMVGMGALLECLKADDVEVVTAAGRTPTGRNHVKLSELHLPDLFAAKIPLEAISGYDACFFCLGVSAAGMSETQYSRMTYDLTLSIAGNLLPNNPNMVFVYVSGQGTDSTGVGKTMWARVKGRTENALLALAFRGVALFRPGAIQPLDGIRSKTRLYQIFYDIARPILPWLARRFPHKVLTTRVMGQAMLECARNGVPKAHMEIADIAELGKIAVHS